ncbi:hypothetical protein CYMTET_42742 [Cymbomonas tetramitiformis]|uniref:Uncharacterized protein n=1 Tax=Cymbomonas tetramitiformis TaxID=36881 RepID=A0AAE0C5I3_9CHLO|nr:hypothetical protein CYMTET_42742 [Cymbomonas tetramitiformis]
MEYAGMQTATVNQSLQNTSCTWGVITGDVFACALCDKASVIFCVNEECALCEECNYRRSGLDSSLVRETPRALKPCQVALSRFNRTKSPWSDHYALSPCTFSKLRSLPGNHCAMLQSRQSRATLHRV